MAFPTIEATSTSEEIAATTSHAVTISTANGHLGIALINAEGLNQSFTWPGGWTELFDLMDGDTESALSAAYRQLDGGEGTSITVTSAVSGRSAHNFYRMSGAEDPATQAPESASQSGAESNPNPPVLTPTGGAKDYLWLASAGYFLGGAAAPTPPANYTNQLFIEEADVTHCVSARRTLNAASEDPGGFTGLTGDQLWAGATIAIHPPSGTTIAQAIAAAGSGAAVLSTVMTAARSIAPSAVGTAAISTLLTYFRTIAPTASGAAVVDTVTTFGRTIAAAGTGAAAVATSIITAITIAASAVGTAVVDKVGVIGQTIAATASGAAALTKTTIYAIVIGVTASGTAALTKIAHFFRTIAASAVGTPALTPVKTAFKTIAAAASGAASVGIALAFGVTTAATVLGAAAVTTAVTIAKIIAVTATAVASVVEALQANGASTYKKMRAYIMQLWGVG